MDTLYVFGTGNAAATRCYNTCFALKAEEEFFMVDAGGGNGILNILEDMNVPINNIHHLFVTHEHTDHVLGVIWMIRIIGALIIRDKYEGDLNLYCHEELIHTIKTICRLTLQKKFYNLLGNRIRMLPVHDGETFKILGKSVEFFDIRSTKAKQYGFSIKENDGTRFTFAGDEPLNPACIQYVENCQWLLHEAFCLYADREQFRPYEKHHSTVKEACELASLHNIANLVLWHTEDKTGIADRKKRYSAEGQLYYKGNLLIPDDGEIIPLPHNMHLSEGYVFMR